jgi:hypothetical protein
VVDLLTVLANAIVWFVVAMGWRFENAQPAAYTLLTPEFN